MLQKKNCTTNFCFALFLSIFRLFFIPFWPIIIKNEWILGYTKGSLQKSFARVTSGCHQLFILFCILLPVLFISIVQASDRFHRVGWSPVQAFPFLLSRLYSRLLLIRSFVSRLLWPLLTSVRSALLPAVVTSFNAYRIDLPRYHTYLPLHPSASYIIHASV